MQLTANGIPSPFIPGPPACGECWTSDVSLLEGDLDGTSNICLLFDQCNSPECSAVGHNLPTASTHNTCEHFQDSSCCATTAPGELVEAARNALRGMFDKCASCASAWERVVCALTCSPKQGSFVHPLIQYTPGLRLDNVTYVLSLHESLAKQLWDSCASDDYTVLDAEGVAKEMGFRAKFMTSASPDLVRKSTPPARVLGTV